VIDTCAFFIELFLFLLLVNSVSLESFELIFLPITELFVVAPLELAVELAVSYVRMYSVG